ncbi:MAG: hypothetical protein ACM3JI_02080 [Anaerolineae bacterium]
MSTSISPVHLPQNGVCIIPEQTFSYLQTCPTINADFSCDTIESFKEFGYVREEGSEIQHRAAKLKVEDVVESSYFQSEFEKKEAFYKKKAALLTEAAEQALARVASEADPARRAMYLDQVRHHLLDLAEIRSSSFAHTSKSREKAQNELESITFQEVLACREAAALSQDSQESLAWLFRGIEVLSLIPSMQRDLYMTPANRMAYERMSERVKTAASLWQEAGAIFQMLPSDARLDYSIFSYRSQERTLVSTQDAAARCYRNAALVLSIAFLDNDPMTPPTGAIGSQIIEAFGRAIELQEAIDTSAWTLLQRAEFQVEIAKTYERRLCLQELSNPDYMDLEVEDRKLVSAQFMRAHELYALLVLEASEASAEPSTHAFLLTRSAVNLATAADFLPTHDYLRRSDLYAQARNFAQMAWNRDPSYCYSFNEFTPRDNYRFQTDILSVYTKAAEYYQDLLKKAVEQEEASYGVVVQQKLALFWDLIKQRLS